MKKWLYTTLAAIIITPIIAASWHNIQSIWAMGEKQKTYEDAYVQNIEFVHEQRMANEINQKQLEAMEKDQKMQWKLLDKLIDAKFNE